MFIYCLFEPKLKTTNSYGGCFFSLKDLYENVSNVILMYVIVLLRLTLGWG